MRINAIERALRLRETLISGDKVLVTNFSDTLQGKDTSKVIDLMPNVETGEYVFRTKINSKEIDPLASNVYSRDFFDMTQKGDKEIEDFLKRAEFDFPLWFKQRWDFSMSRVNEYNAPFILQVAGCNFHDGSETGGCTFCFVDDRSNDGMVSSGKTYLGISETVDSFLSAREKIRSFYAEKGFTNNLRVLRTSGGEPTIVLDWVLGLWKRIESRGLSDIVGQLDSNLSTGSFVQDFEKRGVYEENILHKLFEHPIKVLTALKGTDNLSLRENVQATTTLDEQKYSLHKFLDAGADIYPQMYNPNPKTLGIFLGDLEKNFPNISMRIHIGPLKVYGPTKKRLEAQARILGEDPEKYVAKITFEWDKNYDYGCNVLDAFLRGKHGVGYKDMVRSDIAVRDNYFLHNKRY